MSFASLGLSPTLLPAFERALQALGHHAPTPIQQQAIPLILAGGDLLASAQTGSGKTAAFALPLLQRCAQAAHPMRSARVLVLVPTRELASQVRDTFQQLGSALPRPPKLLAATGGVSINPQLMALRGGADVLVATPGRLLDLLEHNALVLDDVASVVLDEADRLLELGFGEELERILAALPARRQTLLFSATFPPAIDALAQRLLVAPTQLRIAATPTSAPAIEQRAIEVDASQRNALLRHLLAAEGWPSLLVFVASTGRAETLAEKLRKAGIQARPLHGKLAQGRRAATLQEFKRGTLQVLVATDLAARGIDIVELPAVVNYDLPRSTADYIHRIGRTGRAGASGVAISFVDADSEAQLRLIEKREGIRLPRERLAGFEPGPRTAAAPDMQQAAGNGGIKGRRPSKKDKLRAAAAAARPPGE